MTLDEAIIIARKCLHSDNNDILLKKEGISYLDRVKAYNVIAQYHSRINLLEGDKGATEEVLLALNNV